jgi:hypothetical protein
LSGPSTKDVFARSSRIVGRRIAGEYVLVPLVTHGADLDAIYNLNAVAAFIWERLDGRTSGARIVEALLESFEVERGQAEADYLELVTRLGELGAIEAV